MKVKIQIVIESDNHETPITEEVACIQRGELTPETLGITLAALPSDILDKIVILDVIKIDAQAKFLVLIKWRSAVRETPIILAIDVIPTAFSSNNRISLSLPSSFDLPMEFLGLPIALPFARAAVIPSFVRSEIRSRSISANKLNIVTITWSEYPVCQIAQYFP